MCVWGEILSLYGLGKILSVRRRFAVAAGEVVDECKSLLSSQFFGCLPNYRSIRITPEIRDGLVELNKTRRHVRLI